MLCDNIHSEHDMIMELPHDISESIDKEYWR